MALYPPIGTAAPVSTSVRQRVFGDSRTDEPMLGAVTSIIRDMTGKPSLTPSRDSVLADLFDVPRRALIDDLRLCYFLVAIEQYFSVSVAEAPDDLQPVTVGDVIDFVRRPRRP